MSIFVDIFLLLCQLFAEKNEGGDFLETYGRKTIYANYTEAEILNASDAKQKEIIIEKIHKFQKILGIYEAPCSFYAQSLFFK